MAKLGLRTWLRSPKSNGLPRWLWFLMVTGLVSIVCGSLFYSYLQEPIIFAIFMMIYVLAIFCIISFLYKSKFFATFYKTILHPFTFPVVLLFIFAYLGDQYGTSLWNMTIGIFFFFPVFLAIFTAFIWLHHLRKSKNKLGNEDYSYQTAWIYHLTRKFFNNYVFLFILIPVGAFVFFLIIYFFSITVTTEILHVFRYTGTLFQYFLTLSFATIGFLLMTQDDSRKYCKTSIEFIKKGVLSHKDGPQEKIGDYVPIFPTVINETNVLAKKVSLDISPSIPDPYPYYRALFTSVISKNKERLNDVENGLKQVSDALDIKSIDFFYSFVEGLKQIEGTEEKKPKFSDVREALELPFGTVRWIKRNYWYIQIFLMGLSTFLAFLAFIVK